VWSDEADAAFRALKATFCSASVLRHADPTKPFVVETDASDYALGAVLSQRDADGFMHPVAYYSRKFQPAELNYDVYNKELLAIVASLEHWRPYLAGAAHQVRIITDHRNLLYFMTTKQLNRRQARWALRLSEYDFALEHRPGSLHGLADALSRQADHVPKEGDERLLPLRLSLLSADQFVGLAAVASVLCGPASAAATLTAEDHLRIVQECHDSPAAGHFGVAKTLALVKRVARWRGMSAYVKKFVRSCDVCARAKAPRHAPHGLLQPLPIPDRPWGSISMDFITDLPVSHGYDSILVVVDRLTKMAHFVPCKKTATSEDTARLVLDSVVRYHGLPDDIVSDRGPQFAARFWKRLFTLFGTKVNLSTAFHPQSDGQTERVNQVLEQYLRCTVRYRQDDWADLLPMAEFAYNNAEHASTKMSPFFANSGHHPRFGASNIAQSIVPVAEARVQSIVDNLAMLKAELARAQAAYKKFADRHRSAHPEFKVGDKVWLMAKNVKTTRPSKKLDFKRLGPYAIAEQVSPLAFRLDLPAASGLHDVFHVALLEVYHPSTIPGRVPETAPPLELIPGVPEYEVEVVLDSRLVRRRLEYLVAWKTYPLGEASWEPAANLEGAAELVEEFHTKHPNKPKKTNPLRRA
jgi:transposase InsO family protein